MRIPKAALKSGETVNVRCPNPKCKSVLTVTPKKPAPPPAPATQPAAPPPSQDALTDTAAAATSPA
jgi:hypothetical protein